MNHDYYWVSHFTIIMIIIFVLKVSKHRNMYIHFLLAMTVLFDWGQRLQMLPKNDEAVTSHSHHINITDPTRTVLEHFFKLLRICFQVARWKKHLSVKNQEPLPRRSCVYYILFKFLKTQKSIMDLFWFSEFSDSNMSGLVLRYVALAIKS